MGILTTQAQKNQAVLFNITESNNNYAFHKIFDLPTDPSVQLIAPKSPQIGLTYRSENEKGKSFEIMIAFKHFNGIPRSTYLGLVDRMPVPYLLRQGDFHFRLEYGRDWKVPNHPKLLLGIAGSLDPRYTWNRYTPTEIDRHPAYFTSYEMAMNIIPRFTYNINNRIIATIKMPFEALSINQIYATHEDPAIPLNDQMNSKLFADTLHMFRSFHLGIGYYISHQERKRDQMASMINNNIF